MISEGILPDAADDREATNPRSKLRNTAKLFLAACGRHLQLHTFKFGIAVMIII